MAMQWQCCLIENITRASHTWVAKEDYLDIGAISKKIIVTTNYLLTAQ